MTRTRFRSRWLVAWDGRGHRWVPNGELVIEDDTIVHAGASYPDAVDREIDASDALIAPGFVNVHVHAGPLSAGRRFDDHVSPGGTRLGFLQYGAPPAGAPAGAVDDARGQALTTVRDLLSGGTTTAVEIGGETGVPAAAMRDAGSSVGLRLVLGRGFRSRDYVTRRDGTVGYRDRPDGGLASLREAIAFAAKIRDTDDPWMGAMLFPLQVDTCSEALLREAYAAATDLGIPMQIHGAQTRFESDVLARETGRTPVEHLQAADALGPRTIVAHAVLLDHHPMFVDTLRTGSEAGKDLMLLAEKGAAVAHCPVAMARRGMSLWTYRSYRDAGVRVAIGTDTYPRDLVEEMRWAMYLSRVQDGRPEVPTSWDVLASATSVAADLIGRPDLGRLGVGRRADLQIVELSAPRIAAVGDPVGAWIHTAGSSAAREVWVGGSRRFARAGSDDHGADRRPRRPADAPIGDEGRRRRWDGSSEATS